MTFYKVAWKEHWKLRSITNICVSPYCRLNWELDGFQENLIESKQKLREMIADSDLLIITPSYGKRVPKKCNLSPDGWFQVRTYMCGISEPGWLVPGTYIHVWD